MKICEGLDCKNEVKGKGRKYCSTACLGTAHYLRTMEKPKTVAERKLQNSSRFRFKNMEYQERQESASLIEVEKVKKSLSFNRFKLGRLRPELFARVINKIISGEAHLTK